MIYLSPSGGDDSAAFNAAASHCNGGTINLNAGTFNVSNLKMPNNCTINGVGNPVLQVATRGYPLFSGVYASNTTIQNITIDGGGIYANSLTNFSFTNNTIQNIPYTTFWSSNGFDVQTMKNSTIQYNKFLNIGSNCFVTPDRGGPDECNSAVGIYYPSNSVISDNFFDTVEEGIKFFQSPTSGSSLPVANDQISGNTFVRVHRIAIEMQYSADGIVVSGNSFSQWINPFWGSMCISMAAFGHGAITNNVCDGSFSPGAAGYFGICIENMASSDISGNVCEFNSSSPSTWQWGGQIASYAWNMQGTVIQGNVLCGPGIGYLTGLSNRVSVGANTTSKTCAGLYVTPRTS